MCLLTRIKITLTKIISISDYYFISNYSRSYYAIIMILGLFKHV